MEGQRQKNNISPHTEHIMSPVTNPVVGQGLMLQASEGDLRINSNLINFGVAHNEKKQKKKKSKMQPGDEILNFYRDKNNRLRKKIKRLVKGTVHLTPEQVDEINEAFKLFDKDGSGMIDTDELKDAMKALGLAYDKRQVVRLMEQADKDGSGQIDQEEFMSLMARLLHLRNPKEELKKAFKMYDDDDNGTISEENLIKVAQELEEVVSIEEVRLMLRIGDRENKYGGLEVDFDDFMHIM